MSRFGLRSVLVSLLELTGATYCTNTSTLYVNAIVGNNNASTVECWGISPGYDVSSEPGTVGNKLLQMGDLSNASYTIFPNHGTVIDSGLHNAPHPQWVVLLSGSVSVNFPNVSMPDLNISVEVPFIAADVAGTSEYGHRSFWGSGSTVLQMPFKDGLLVNHTFISDGQC